MNYALDQFTMTDGEVLIVQGAKSLYTYQNTGNSPALIQGSNDTTHWTDIAQIAVGNSLVKEHSYKYLRLVGQTRVDVNRGEGNNSNDSNLVTSVQGQLGDVYLDAEDVNADPAGAAENVKNLLQLQVSELASTKLNTIDYVQHFRGLFSSYAALVSAIPTATNGDYAHIDSGSGFDRMSAIWDGDELPNGAWKVQNVNTGANTDEVPEGSSNLYFTSIRAQQAALLALLTGLDTTISTPALSTDTIKQAIGKLQAQINNSNSSGGVTWVKANTVGTVHPNFDLSNLEFARFDDLLYMRGSIKVLYTTSAGITILDITNNSYKIKRLIPSNISSKVDTAALGFVGLGGTSFAIRLRVTNNCIDAATALSSSQVLDTFSTVTQSDIHYSIYPTCLGELVIK